MTVRKVFLFVLVTVSAVKVALTHVVTAYSFYFDVTCHQLSLFFILPIMGISVHPCRLPFLLIGELIKLCNPSHIATNQAVLVTSRG